MLYFAVDRLLLAVLLASVAVIAVAVAGGSIMYAVLPPTSAGVIPAESVNGQADFVSLIATVVIAIAVAAGSLIYLRKTMSGRR
jgi:hypothetical protein